MAAWVCVACSTVFSVGAPRCPHCASTTYYEEGQDVGKISKAAGASIAPEPVAPAEPEPVVGVAPAPVAEPVAEPEPEPAPEPAPVPAPAKRIAAKKSAP